MAISADLGDALETVVKELVSSGRYGSKSEVLREGVRLVQEREARLKALDAVIERSLAEDTAGLTEPVEDSLGKLSAKYRAGARKAG